MGLQRRASAYHGVPAHPPSALHIRFSRVWLGQAAIGGDRRMRIEQDQLGDFVLEPTALAEKLSIPPEDLRRRMGLGLLTSLVETGEGADAGLRRVTARCGAAVWRAVVDADGRIEVMRALGFERFAVVGHDRGG